MSGPVRAFAYLIPSHFADIIGANAITAANPSRLTINAWPVSGIEIDSPRPCRHH